jgi:exopolysaccharide biosynthesis predicted pyruvyltransferase EpsI
VKNKEDREGVTSTFYNNPLMIFPCSALYINESTLKFILHFLINFH